MTEKDTEKFYYCMNICPHLDRYYGWCNYNNTQDFDYKKCKIIRDKFKEEYEEIQPIAIDGKIIDLKTKEVIEDLNIGVNKFKDIKTRKGGNLIIKKRDKNCHNCKNCETYDEGEGYGYVSLCKKDCMNTDGYFDYEYHRFKKPCICPFWEEDEYD